MKNRIILLAVLFFSCVASFGQKPKVPQPIIAEKSNIFGYAYDRDKKQMVLNYIYEEANEFDANVLQAIVKYKGHYAVIDTGGGWILEPIFEDIHFNPDYNTYTAKLNGKYGVYGTDGKLRLAHKFDNLGATTRGWYEGELDGNWVYVSPEGKITTSTGSTPIQSKLVYG